MSTLFSNSLPAGSGPGPVLRTWPCVSVLIMSVLVFVASCGEPVEEGPRPRPATSPSPDTPLPEDAVSPVPVAPDLADHIAIDGSSTVFPITEAVAEEFEAAAPGVTVRLGVSGTGGGFRKFCRGRTDISDASRPIKDVEAELCRQNGIDFVELPVAYDGLTVVVHKGNEFATCLSVGELHRIWQPESEGVVTNWSQVREGWPDLPLHLFGAGDDSGTYDYFTEAVVGEEGASRGDFIASEDDYLIAQDVAADPSALGFFGLAYAREYGDRLRIVAVDPDPAGVADPNAANSDRDGRGCVLPTDDAVRGGTYVPLSRPIFVYVSVAALERSAVRSFLEFYLSNASRVVQEVGYVALPERAYELARQRLTARTTGSMFSGGSQVGVSVERLLELEGAP